MSAQPCGCDPEASWLCQIHQDQIDDFKAATYMDFPARDAASTRVRTLPTEGAARKLYPVASGVLDYFPDAIVAVARVSYQGNEQHNPGQPLHWAREKSTDHADTLVRHLLQRGTLDIDGMRHSAKAAWRALALLQVEIEQEQR